MADFFRDPPWWFLGLMAGLLCFAVVLLLGFVLFIAAMTNRQRRPPLNTMMRKRSVDRTEEAS